LLITNVIEVELIRRIYFLCELDKGSMKKPIRIHIIIKTRTVDKGYMVLNEVKY